jgi:hypothetical protein
MDQEFGKDWDFTFDPLELLRVTLDGIAMQVKLFVPTRAGERLPVRVEIHDPGRAPRNSANHQGQVEDRRSGATLIASFREGYGHQLWTNEWIILDRVTI